MPTIIVNFRKKSGPRVCPRKLQPLIGPQLGHAQPLLPRDPDPGMSTLFYLELAPGVSSKDVLPRLQGDKDIEYAHVAEERRPL